MAHGTICWSELCTPDVEGAKAHYAALAGWTFEGMDMPSETYWVAHHEGKPIAGIFSGADIPYEVPPHWLTYIAVADIDAAAETVRQTGGKVLREPFDVPGVGRIAIAAEPGGAAAGLIQPAEGS